MKQSENKITAIEKVLKVMMAFEPEAEEKGTVELSQELDLNKATVSRIANTLADHGFLLRNPQKQYLRRRSQRRIRRDHQALPLAQISC